MAGRPIRFGNPKRKLNQEPVRIALHGWTMKFPSQIRAAMTLGVHEQTLSDWRHGKSQIPNWVCDLLGFRQEWVNVGTARFSVRQM